MTRRPVRASPAVCQRADAGCIRGQAVSVEELGELGYALACRRWRIRKELALAIFDYIEAFYNPKRQHSSFRQKFRITEGPSGRNSRVVATRHARHLEEVG